MVLTDSETPIVVTYEYHTTGQVDVSLPFPTIDAKGGGRVDCDIPFCTIDATAKRSHGGTVDVTLPMMTIEAVGYMDVNGQVDVTLPLPTLYARASRSGRFDDYVLRYSRGL